MPPVKKVSFGESVGIWVTKTKKAQNSAFRSLIVFGYRTVRRRSPYKTGRFRASWRVSVGSDIDTTVADEGDFSQRPESVAPIVQRAIDRINAGDRVNITNSLPYAEPLEHGHSKQAPQGILRPTLVEMRQEFPRIIQKAKAERG